MKLHKQQGHVALGLLALTVFAALAVAGVYGYIHNIVALVHASAPYALLELLRGIGILVFPLGIVLGLFA